MIERQVKSQFYRLGLKFNEFIIDFMPGRWLTVTNSGELKFKKDDVNQFIELKKNEL